MIQRIVLLLIAWTTLTVAHAQSVDKVYKEGKALYEAKKYDAALPKLKAPNTGWPAVTTRDMVWLRIMR